MRSKRIVMTGVIFLSTLQTSLVFSQENLKPSIEDSSRDSSVSPLSKQSEMYGLSLAKALENVERYSSLILGADSYTASLEGRRVTAGSIPNPELNFEMEKFAGTRSSKGLTLEIICPQCPK